MSSDKTVNLNLHKWSGKDYVKRTEFNENFDTVDTEIERSKNAANQAEINAKDYAKGYGIDKESADFSDFNNLTEPGFYKNGTKSVMNAPDGDGWYTVFVSSRNSSSVGQIAIERLNGADPRIFSRTAYSGTWSRWIELESVSGAQQKVKKHAVNTNNPHNVTADQVGLSSSNFSSVDVKGGMDELFTNVSNGKGKIATAITGKEVPTSGSDSFDYMASNINAIEVGDYKIGDVLNHNILDDPKKFIWSYYDAGLSFKLITVKDENNIYVHSDKPSLIKLDGNGNKVWEYIPASKKVENLQDILIDGSGEILIMSYQIGLRGHSYLTKVSDNGTEIWNYSPSSRSHAIEQDKDGYIYIGLEGKIEKIDSDGNEVETISLDINGSIYSLILLDNYNMYVGSYDSIAKVDNHGSKLWKLSIEDNAKGLELDSLGNVYVGIHYSSHGASKISPSGSEIWAYTKKEKGGVESIATDSFDNLYLSGYNLPGVIKLNSYGNEVFRFSGNTFAIDTDRTGNIYRANRDHVKVYTTYYKIAR